jgi:exonuclease SbcC
VIESIELNNWASHEKTTLKFNKGANIFLGNIGSGKSSVLKAITYALFGQIPKISRDMKTESLIKDGHETATITLDLFIDGNSYKIQRSISKKGQAKALLYKNDMLITTGTENVNEYVEKILGFDADLFSKAIYAEQNALEHLLNIKPADRKIFVDRLLGIDKIQEAAKKAKTVSNQLRNHSRSFYEQISNFKIEEKEKELEELKKSINELTEQVKKSKEQLNEIYKKLEITKNQREQLIKSMDAHNELVNKLKHFEGKLATLEKSYKIGKESKERKKAIEEQLNNIISKEKVLEQKRKDLEQKIKDAYAIYKHIEKEIKEKEALMSNLETINKKLEKLKERDLANELESTNKALVDLQSFIKAKQEQIKQANIAIEHLKTAKKGKCPTCNTELGQEGIERVIKFWHSTIKEINIELEQRSKELYKILDKKKEIENNIEAKRTLEEQVKIIKQKIEKIPDNKQVETAKESYEVFKAEGEKVKKELQDLINEKTTLEKELHKLNIIIDEATLYEKYEKDKLIIEQQIKELNFKKEDLEKITVAYERLKEEYSAIKERVNAYEEKINYYLKNASNIEKELDNNKRLIRRAKKLESVAQEFSIMSSALESYQVLRRDSLINALNNALSTFWQLLYPYKDYLTAFIKIDQNGDYKFYVSNGKEEKLLDTVASGGERATYALSLRIALAFTLAKKLRWLILDEPTHNLDELGVFALKDAIRYNLPSVVEQFFIITHDERLKDHSLGKVFVFSRGADKTESTNVSLLN